MLYYFFKAEKKGKLVAYKCFIEDKESVKKNGFW